MGREHGETMYLMLAWDVSRTHGIGGIRMTWTDETGWAYTPLGANPRIQGPHRPLTPLRRIFARPDDVAEVAERLVRDWRTPTGDYHAEWDAADKTRTAIADFRDHSPSSWPVRHTGGKSADGR
ncbi:hypothetical protein [Streptomyces sp. NPDC054794]